MHPLLLADDDIELCDMLAQYLEAEDFSVTAVHDGEAALAEARSGRHELAVLDIMMPRMSGLDVLRELRRDSQLPVLILTARGDDVDSIVGLELGADDYLPKPASPRVLVARIRAILRRAAASTSAEAAAPAQIALGDLEIHTGSRSVELIGSPVPMTSTEYSLLEYLALGAGRVIGKEELSQQVLGRKLEAYDRGIDMHVSNLRRKLGPLPGGEERIKTVRGVGYQYVLDGE
ncbi:MAG TPA: response regulator transcription factor [Gammaproteobacteria bacterium]|nr:response regulator transcription factor [Gammaproteobacteria bacterium]